MRTLSLLAVLAVSIPTVAAAVEIPINIASSDGTVVRTPGEAASVLIADPGVADVQLLSDQSLFLFGKTPGTTRLFVLNAEEEIMLERKVIVTRPLSELHGETVASQ